MDNPLGHNFRMLPTGPRLKLARKEAGFADASDAARALDIPVPTYSAHENGRKGLSRAGERYARFFGVSLEWLMTGKGDMRPRARAFQPPPIPMMGKVGAGGRVGPLEVDEPADHIDWPDPVFIGALTIDGDSQTPRYMHGEVILYDRRPRVPSDLVGRYCVVDRLDGRRMVKLLRRPGQPSPRGETWRLESLNAPQEDNVPLLAAYEIWPRPRR